MHVMSLMNHALMLCMQVGTQRQPAPARYSQPQQSWHPPRHHSKAVDSQVCKASPNPALMSLAALWLQPHTATQKAALDIAHVIVSYVSLHAGLFKKEH